LADDDPENRRRLDTRYYRADQGATALRPRRFATRARHPADRRSVDLRQGGDQRGSARGRHRRRADRAHDPAVSWELALDADHHDLDSAISALLDHRA